MSGMRRRSLQDDDGVFNLPGGTPEPEDAGLAETLVREAFEESQVRVGATVYLGYQEVRRPGRARYAQVRMAGVIEQFAPRAPDPDGGRVCRRLMTSLAVAPGRAGMGTTRCRAGICGLPRRHAAVGTADRCPGPGWLHGLTAGWHPGRERAMTASLAASHFLAACRVRLFQSRHKAQMGARTRSTMNVQRKTDMWEQVGRLHRYHGDVPAEVRLLKLTEEVGEAAEAFIGMRGLNARKGICRSRDDLLAELADVIITAVAMSGITGDTDEARVHLEQRLAVVTERAGL
jgi:NTP pyrophosphatase (non-canonical NTP hydrolase)/ADP-ribose pyrophosphatase YjhB (NUDIX family)